MAKLHQRVFALVLAVVFFATSVGFSIVVIQQMRKEDEAKKIQARLQEELESTAPTEEAQQEENNGGNKLQGTKLTNYTPVEKVEALEKIDLIAGTGDEVVAGATVTAHYTGALAKDGTIFESSKDTGKPATFPLSRVIKGWQEGVPGMKVGGIRRLVIPASLAYGEMGSPPKIGPNEPLIFDIELVSVQ